MVFVLGFGLAKAQHEAETHPGQGGDSSHMAMPAEGGAHEEHGSGAYDPVSTAMHHISDANEFHIFGDNHLPLPCILYAPDAGFTTCMSSAFHHGEKAIDRYVLVHGRVKRVSDPGFPSGEVEVSGFAEHEEEVAGKKKEVAYVLYEGKEYALESASTLDGGLFGGGITSFIDFSITRNVATLFLVALLLILVFTSVASAYKKRAGQAPKGLQSLLEPVFLFIRDEVCKPMLGKRTDTFAPYIYTVFFFVLLLNLLGLVPFFPGGSNVTGNLSVTMALALMTFLITNLNGNKHYWEHILWMPGIPAWVKIILTPVEVLGLFIKPFSLMIRLFANITAGHIIILSLVGLIFIFGKNGESIPGAISGGIMGVLFTAFMNLIELMVAFIQAFIFAILSASYIGAAIEEEHH